MYSQLYEVWKQELEYPELVKLPPDFYTGIVEYVKKLKEESRMLDKRTAKANLLKKEMQNTKRMVKELVRARYRKILGKVAGGEEAPREILTVEEEQFYAKISPLVETVSNFASETLHGHEPKTMSDSKHKRITMRMLKEIPGIIGADMKTYGPFKTEDVASIPVENARILAKQNLAEKVEIN
jgi:DNA replication factor GINS